MSWNELLARKDAQKHATSKAELDNMRELIARDLADVGVAGLSSDRRFATAYNVAATGCQHGDSVCGLPHYSEVRPSQNLIRERAFRPRQAS